MDLSGMACCYSTPCSSPQPQLSHTQCSPHPMPWGNSGGLVLTAPAPLWALLPSSPPGSEISTFFLENSFPSPLVMAGGTHGDTCVRRWWRSPAALDGGMWGQLSGILISMQHACFLRDDSIEWRLGYLGSQSFYVNVVQKCYRLNKDLSRMVWDWMHWSPQTKFQMTFRNSPFPNHV